MFRTTAYLAGGAAALGLGYYLLRARDGAGSVLDQVGDDLVLLTTSEESRLADLEAGTQAAARALIQALHEDGLEVHVGQTLRTTAQERAQIDAGHSAVKTHSWHELGRALDLYPINPDTGSPDFDGIRIDLFVRMHDAAAAAGFHGLAFNPDGTKRLITTAAGKKIWDAGHLEWRAPYGTIAQAVAAEGAAFGVA